MRGWRAHIAHRALPALACAGLIAGGTAAPAADASTERVRKGLAQAMRAAGPASGAYVIDTANGQRVFSYRASRRRILASNTKLFTTAAALDRLGAGGVLRTRVLGTGELREDGTYRGDLHLQGGGDPTFGSAALAGRLYGSRATVEELALRVRRAGVREVDGRVIGDESRFDSRRGGPGSGWGVSFYVGPLSALAYNRGLVGGFDSALQGDPPAFAAARLQDALRRAGVRVRRKPRARGPAPREAAELAGVASPPLARLVRAINKPSDNFAAELLLKALAADGGLLGTTRRGARRAVAFARGLGSRPRLADGSGLSRGNAASPRSVVALLRGMVERDDFRPFQDSLPVAGRDGTLAGRMRGGPARGRCRAKTGTLSNVSSLSGYCSTRAGGRVAFSILMNRIFPGRARALQDRMLHLLAGSR